MASRNFRPVETQATGVAGGLALLALGGLVWYAIQVGRDVRAERSRQWAIAWAKPGTMDVNNQIKVHGSVVGKVVQVGFPTQRLGVEISATDDPTRWDATHIGVGESTTVAARSGHLTILWRQRDSVVIRQGGDSVVLVGGESTSGWVARQGVRRSDSAMWTGIPRCEKGKPDRCLKRGGTLHLDGVDVRWLGIETVARAVIDLDRGQIEAAITPSVVDTMGAAKKMAVDSNRLVGVELRETGAFGIGKQGLKLIVPDAAPGLIVDRPRSLLSKPARPFVALFAKPKPHTAVELVSREGLDLDNAKAMLSYLSDPARRRAEPVTRWEDMVSEGGASVERLNAAIATLQASLAAIKNVTTPEGGNGMIGRMLVSTPEQGRLREAVDALPDMIAQLERLAGTMEVTIDSTGRSVRRLTHRVDSTLAVLEPDLARTLQGARTLEDSLVTLTKQLETTLASAKRTGKPVGIALLVKLLASTLLDVARLGGIR